MPDYGFSPIIGHDQIKEVLQRAAKKRQPGHAYILEGDAGSGRRMLAKAFAMSLLCENFGGGGRPMEPCGACKSCVQFLTDNHPDVKVVTHEKASLGVEDIRAQLVNDMQIKPYEAPYKVYLVPEAEKMTAQAQNALLKTLEEPPEYAVIMLLTSNLEAMLPTILSRCVVLNMKPVPDDLIKSYLMRELQIPDYKADVCTAFAQGNLGKAKALAASEEFDNIKTEAVSLLRYIREMEITDIVSAINKIKDYKIDINDYLDILSVWYRDVLLFKATNDANHLIFKDEIQYIKNVANQSAYEGIEVILEALEKAKARLRANVSFEMTMELLLLTIKEN